MPLTANESKLLSEIDFVDAHLDFRHQRRDRAPDDKRKIGRLTLVLMILNRIIGSGIFFAPKRVLAGTGCVGGALCLWALAALITICGTYVWNECAFGMPQTIVNGELEPRGVPKNAGEKNYLEYVFRNANLRLPHLRTTCCFAVMFILLYNLSSNALAFAIQALTASGAYNPALDGVPPRGQVIGIAIGVLTLVVVAHTVSRKGGIYINNAFAIVKVALLLIIFCLGVAKAGGAFGGSRAVVWNNFVWNVWETKRSDLGSWCDSLMLCLFCFSGFEQPFYVITEARSPRRYFPKYTVIAVLIAAVLFMLVNISYLLVVDKDEIMDGPLKGWYLNPDFPNLFFNLLLETESIQGARAMAAVIAISIFGNLWVMTFTAARVKQELAKEGILPCSLFFATSYRTPYGLWQEWTAKEKLPPQLVERAPTAAFALHWFSSVLLIAVTSPISDPRKSYSILVYLFTYSMVLVLGAWVSIGLAIVKISKNWHWAERRRYRPWLSPVHVIVYGLSTSFLALAAFAPPSRDSPFYHTVTGVPWYVLPAIGITAPFWGIIWYFGFQAYEKITETQLKVIRKRLCVPDAKYPEEYVQQAELFSHWWPYRSQGHEFPDEAPGDDSIGHRDFVSSDEALQLEDGRGLAAETSHRRGPVENERRLSDSFDS